MSIQAADPQGLARFQRAASQAALLKRSAGCLGLLIALLLLLMWRGPAGSIQPLLAVNAAMLLLLLAGVLAALSIVHWRSRALNPVQGAVESSSPYRSSSRLESFRRHLRRGLHGLIALTRLISAQGWTAIISAVLSLAALLVLLQAWHWPLRPVAPDAITWSVVGITLLMAFALLVLERYCAAATTLPEAAQLAALLRVALTVALLSAACLSLVNEARLWPARAALLLFLLPALLALELALRAMLAAFVAPQPQQEPEMLVDSLLASLWRWPPRPLQNLQAELQQRFGIDLRQNWAFAYIRRALLPVCGAILLCAWLLTAVVEIGSDARGIHERFGKPVAVWNPGLHLALPWPMSRVRIVENGVVHELATASASDADGSVPAVEVVAAEAAPPASANRLWDASHVAEKSQVIASRAGDRQSFHIVNMDVRFIYRVGLSDAAALAATYHSTDLPALIRSTANRVLVRYFASRTLEGVLGERRTQLAIDIRQQVQSDLNALDSGVEILATVIEAIHPPAAAAYAYHSVQAAQINAQSIIARERGSAAEQVNLAQLRANMAMATATAAARETVATAQAAQRRFSAERDAYAKAGKAFLFEQYLAQLSQGLASAQLIVLDHRLRGASATVDLRSFASGEAVRAEP